jgi:hypothetical protein
MIDGLVILLVGLLMWMSTRKALNGGSISIQKCNDSFLALDVDGTVYNGPIRQIYRLQLHLRH